jgi:hypothetical protein
MMKYMFCITLLLGAISICCYGISRIYSGKPIPLGMVKDGFQVIQEGKPLIAGLDVAPTIIYYNDQDHSFTFSIHGSTDPDSILLRVTPGDLFSVRVSANVSWNDDVQRFRYIYDIQSLQESQIPIETAVIRLGFDPWLVLVPMGWGLNKSVGYTSWYASGATQLMPGRSLSGFGFESASPPILKEIELYGESAIVMAHEWDEGPDIPSFLDDTEGVRCLTIAPGPLSEKIQAAEWVTQIMVNLGKLVSNGYLSYERSQQVNGILSGLFNALGNPANTSFDKWNPLVNTALDSLTVYQTLIEPEAYSYITENLKYMQRHKDIVWFGKYVPPPEQRQE